MLIYITNPAIAAATGLPLGFATAEDSLGALLVAGRNAYDFNHPETFPVIGYVDATADPYPPPAPVPSPPPPSPPPPPPPPAPPPAGRTLHVGAEDQHHKIDIDGDGTTDVHVLVDNPPKNTP